jgi:hypothetical protein
MALYTLMQTDLHMKTLAQQVLLSQLYAKGPAKALQSWKIVRAEIRRKHVKPNVTLKVAAQPSPRAEASHSSISIERVKKSPVIKAMGKLDTFYQRISPRRRQSGEMSYDSCSTFKSFDGAGLVQGHNKRISEISLPMSDFSALQDELPLSQLQRLCLLIDSQSLSELPSEYRSSLETFAKAVVHKIS